MPYRAKKKFDDPESAKKVLHQLPENGSYRVNRSFYNRKPSVIFSEHSVDEAIDETYKLATQLNVTINYNTETVRISGSIGPLPVSSMKGAFEAPSWSEFKNFLEQTGDWQ